MLITRFSMQGDLSFFFLSSTMISFHCCRKQLQVEGNHYCVLIPIITDTCSKIAFINICITNKLDTQCHYFIHFHNNYLCNRIFVYVRAGAMAASFTNHHSHRNCCMWASGVPFAFTLSPVKMVVDKGGEGVDGLTKKSPSNTTFCPQMGLAPEPSPSNGKKP